MSLTIVSVDLTTLPTALLPVAKQHLRIDWTGEDAFIQSIIARAIARVEQVNDVSINQISVVWDAFAENFKDGAITLPVRPVTNFAANDTADPPNEVTADYSIARKWDSAYGVPIEILEGNAQTLVLALTAGMPTLPPPVEDMVLRHAAHLYNHREILLPGREYVAPDLQLDSSWWTPRV